jgi:hypothetical protein
LSQKIKSTSALRIGDKVHYQPEHYGDGRWENGIIKEIRDNNTKAVWVVYNCNEEWFFYASDTAICFTPAILREIADKLEEVDKSYTESVSAVPSKSTPAPPKRVI